MNTRLSSLFILSFCVSLFAGRASASDWFVDAINGSNSNGGTSATDAWRTLTWAVAHAPAQQGETIHVAPGLYDSALGELFPIQLLSGQRIVGAARETVIVKAPISAGTVFLLQTNSISDAFLPSSGLEQMTLQHRGGGVVLQANDGVMSPLLRDLAIDCPGEYGIAVAVQSDSPIRAAPVLENVIGQSSIGLQCWSSTPMDVRVRDCSFSDCLVGVSVIGPVDLALDRCRLQRNGTESLRSHAPALGMLQTVVVRDSTLTDNDGSGVHVIGGGVSHGARNFTLQRCTIAGNVDTSLRVSGGWPPVNVSIIDSILASETLDVSLASLSNAQVLAVNSLIRDGFSNGVNGCFSADPLFRDVDSDNYRLAFGSPCIDRGPQFPGVALDVLGHARTVDGDLDVARHTDLGAFEARPLEGPSTVAAGSLLTLETSGPIGAISRVYWSRYPILSSPVLTTYGSSYLSFPLIFRVTTTNGATPALVSRSVPVSPAVIGHTFPFQARTQSAAAPAGEAYSNPLSITIVP